MSCRHFILAIISMLSGACICCAKVPLMKYGIEWGFSPNISFSHHTNYLTEDGYMVDDLQSGMCFNVNSYLMGNVGINVGRQFSLSILSGYAGIGKNNRMIPLLLRMDYYLKGSDKDGFLGFIDGGAGLHLRREGEPKRNVAIIADAGIGYRITLTPRSSIDFLFNGKWTFDSLMITDPNSGAYVPDYNIRSNNAFFLSLNLGVGLNF